MPTYDIYYRSTKVATITPPDESKRRYTLDMFGLCYMDFPQAELLITCNREDVRVTRDGEDVTMKVLREILPSYFSPPDDGERNG